MNKSLELKQDKEEETILPFTVIEGGKGGPTGNWLEALPVNTMFLTAPKELKKEQECIIVNCYQVLMKTPQCTQLKNLDTREVNFVRTEKFSRVMERIEVIGEAIYD